MTKDGISQTETWVITVSYIDDASCQYIIRAMVKMYGLSVRDNRV